MTLEEHLLGPQHQLDQGELRGRAELVKMEIVHVTHHDCPYPAAVPHPYERIVE